jgi:hypothetical protein
MIAENRIPKTNITYIHRVKYRLNTSCVTHFSLPLFLFLWDSLSLSLSLRQVLSLLFFLTFEQTIVFGTLSVQILRFTPNLGLWAEICKHPIFNFYCSFICIFSRFSLQLGMSVSYEFDSVSDKNFIFL